MVWMLALAGATELSLWVGSPDLPMGASVVDAVAGVHHVQSVETEDGVLTLMLDIGKVEVRVGEGEWRPAHTLGELPDLSELSRLELSLQSEAEGRVIENTHLQVGMRIAAALDAVALADMESGVGVAGTNMVHFLEGRTDPSAMWVAIVTTGDVMRTEGLAERGHPEIEIRGLGEDSTEAELVLRALVRSWLAEGRRVRRGNRIVIGGVSHAIRGSRARGGDRVFWIDVQAGPAQP